MKLLDALILKKAKETFSNDLGSTHWLNRQARRFPEGEELLDAGSGRKAQRGWRKPR